MNFQTIIFSGRVGRDCEMRYSPQGKAVASFPVAVNQEYNGEKSTLWVRVTVWEKQAEVCQQWVKKGMQVIVEGRLDFDKQTGGPRIWEDEDGNRRANYEVVATTVRFGGGGEKQESRPQEHSRQDEEDLPF